LYIYIYIYIYVNKKLSGRLRAHKLSVRTLFNKLQLCDKQFSLHSWCSVDQDIACCHGTQRFITSHNCLHLTFTLCQLNPIHVFTTYYLRSFLPPAWLFISSYIFIMEKTRLVPCDISFVTVSVQRYYSSDPVTLF
jgi:hypothetical protein